MGVTVELNQAWTSGGDVPNVNPIDHIFSYYRDNDFSKRCYETKNVEEGVFDTITIHCNLIYPKANLEICVADSLSNNVLNIEDTAEVPECCYPSFPPDTPVVCYLLQINCVSECLDESQQR